MYIISNTSLLIPITSPALLRVCVRSCVYLRPAHGCDGDTVVHLFPTPRSVVSLWQLEAIHGGVLTPQNSANTANQGFFPPSRGRALRHLREHATAYVTRSGAQGQQNDQSSYVPTHVSHWTWTSCRRCGQGCRLPAGEPGSGHLLTAPPMAEVTTSTPKGSLGHTSLEPPRYFLIDSKYLLLP